MKLIDKFNKTNKKNQIKTIYWIRHGEALSNVSELNSQIIDPSLTFNGLSQCNKLKKHIKISGIDSKIDLIVCSPLLRALETCYNVFNEQIYQTNFIVLDQIREHIDKPCHKRSNISELKPKYKFMDFSNVTNEDVEYKNHNGQESKSNVISRCEWFIDWICGRKEKNIVVITHGNFLYPMFNNVLNSNLTTNKSFFSNCEIRTSVIDKLR